MADYISREAAIEKITALINKSGKYTAYESGADDACFILEHEIPAADVRPVVMAAWLTGNDNPRTYGRIRAMCGRCGAFALCEMVNAGSYKEKQSNYCPNCGADMRPEPGKETET